MLSPNILLITSDQQHWNTIGAFNPEIRTPNLDRLAAQGSLFDRAYCPNPTCTPTRSSIITGKYPSQHGAWSLGTKLSEGEHTVGEDFQKAGYRTSLIGKAHFQPLRGTAEFSSLESYPILQDLDFWKHFHGDFYGFEHVELARNHTNEAHVGQHYALWMEEKGLANWRDYFLPPTGRMDKSEKRTWKIPEEYHYDAWIAERTNAMLQGYKENGENFFLWASFFDPHPDYFAPEPWDRLYDPETLTLPSAKEGEHEGSPPHFKLTQEQHPDFSAYSVSGYGLHGFHSHLHDDCELRKDMAVYYGMISLMDKYIGKILDRLDELGLSENTLVLFTSDHGHFFGQHGLMAKGAFHYEDMIKVPFIVRYPGVIPAGRISLAMQSLVDLAPSFLDLIHAPVPASMTGIGQSEVWKGEKESARGHVLVENHHEHPTIHVKTYVDRRYKITVYYNQTYGEIFDLEEDPGELRNLWDDETHAELKARLLLKFLWAEMGIEPLRMPRIASA